MKIVIAAMFLWISAANAQTMSIRVTPVQPEGWHSAPSNGVAFSCTTDYDPQGCMAGASALAKVLERYPSSKLGDWTFVLAASTHWKQTVKALGGDTESPAFTELEAHVTVLEDTLFESTGSRKELLSRRFGLPAGSILDFAVTHEMGHAICNERNEKLAEEYGLDLRRGISPVCKREMNNLRLGFPKWESPK
jgi:hypothetical protein